MSATNEVWSVDMVTDVIDLGECISETFADAVTRTIDYVVSNDS